MRSAAGQACSMPARIHGRPTPSRVKVQISVLSAGWVRSPATSFPVARRQGRRSWQSAWQRWPGSLVLVPRLGEIAWSRSAHPAGCAGRAAGLSSSSPMKCPGLPVSPAGGSSPDPRAVGGHESGQGLLELGIIIRAIPTHPRRVRSCGRRRRRHRGGGEGAAPEQPDAGNAAECGGGGLRLATAAEEPQISRTASAISATCREGRGSP